MCILFHPLYRMKISGNVIRCGECYCFVQMRAGHEEAFDADSREDKLIDLFETSPR